MVRHSLLAAHSIDKNNAIPLYHQIFVALRDAVLRGDIAYGTILPTEQELSELYSVSRITSRRAMQELAHAGLVERRRRSGTRIIHRAEANSINVKHNTSREGEGAHLHSTDISIEDIVVIPSPLPVSQHLNLTVESEVMRARCLQHAQGQCLSLNIHYVPAHHPVSLTAKSLKQNRLQDILKQAGIGVHRIQQTIEAISADPSLANSLKVEPCAPLLKTTQILENEHGHPVAASYSYYRADRFRLTEYLNAVDTLQEPVLAM